MEAFRKWLFKPKREDESLFAQFFYADEELNAVAAELDSFDGRKHPERCTKLVSRLRHCQDKVLNICTDIMDEIIFEERSHRDFRVKFPDDILQDNLSGQLWFGAECLAAGSSIINREIESAHMRPLAKAVTKSLDNVRSLLREQCFKHIPEYTEKIRESLKIFDRLFAEFELEYVSAMVPVKSVHEYDLQQDVVVLFSETLDRAIKKLLVNQDSIDNCDPSLMFTIPRLAIIYGLVINPEGPLNLDKAPQDLSQMFRPFRNLLKKVKELLLGLSIQDICVLEQSLCSEGGSDQLNIRQSCDNDLYLDTKEHNFLIKSHLNSMNSEGREQIGNYNPRPAMDGPMFEIDEVISNPDDSRNKSESDLQGSTHLLEESLSSLSQESPSTAARVSDQLYSEDLSDNDDCSTAQDSLSSTDSYASAELDDDIKVAYHTAKSAIQLEIFSSPTSTSNLLHKLFVCISGVADQLQTNFAGDLSNILKSVFMMHSTESDKGSLNGVETAEDALTSPSSSVHNPPGHIDLSDTEQLSRTTEPLSNNYTSNLGSVFYSSLSLDSDPLPPYALYQNTSLPDPSLARLFTSLLPRDNSEGLLILQEIMSTSPPHLCYSLGEDHSEMREGPSWIPDSQVSQCMACDLPFTVIRRRHHCRNCGKVFCSKCSGNNVPLPHIGHNDPVRVCNSCFMFHIAPFFMQGAL